VNSYTFFINNTDIFAARVKDINSDMIIKKNLPQGENFVSLAELYGYGGLRGIYLYLFIRVYLYMRM
jgi:hypothetical protein